MDNQPWWNDGDKVAGAAATFVFILVAAVAIALVAKLIIWMF